MSSLLELAEIRRHAYAVSVETCHRIGGQSTLRPPSILTSSALPQIQVDLGALFV